MTIGPNGLLPVLETPFSEDEASIDYQSLEREIDWLFDQGADGIVIGMLSEFLRLSDEERTDLTKAACRLAAGRGPVVASVGAEATVVAVCAAKRAEDIGAAAVMAIPPITVAATPSDLLRYYEAIINATAIPVIVQDASAYLGHTMPIEVLATLQREFPDRVLFKPEAPPVGLRLGQLLAATEGRALVIDGTGGAALAECFPRGVMGTMPAADLIWAVGSLWSALSEGDRTRADAIRNRLAAFMSLQQSLDSYIVIGKHVLVKRGIFNSAAVRSPITVTLDESMTAEIDYLLAQLREVAA